MAFIYFGTGHFSRLTLEGLLQNNCRPSLVITSPDKPKGRGLKFFPSPVGELAQEARLNLIKPASIKGDDFLTLIKQSMADFILVADYGKILPQAVLDIPAKLSFAVHPSLLPFYRGATPLNRPFINGDRETGVTIFKMAATMDSGPIIDQAKVAIRDEDDVLTITQRLSVLGAQLAAGVLLSGEFTLTEQNEGLATYAPKFTKEDGLINWTKTPRQIADFIRGTMGWPSAYTFFDEKRVQIVKVKPIDGACVGEPGAVAGAGKDGIDVIAGGGILRIIEVKPEGKGVMPASAFVCGNNIKIGDMFYAQ